MLHLLVKNKCFLYIFILCVRVISGEYSYKSEMLLKHVLNPKPTWFYVFYFCFLLTLSVFIFSFKKQKENNNCFIGWHSLCDKNSQTNSLVWIVFAHDKKWKLPFCQWIWFKLMREFSHKWSFKSKPRTSKILDKYFNHRMMYSIIS